MTRILWLSRHSPLPVQREELLRIWPGSTLDQDVSPFANAEEILRRVRVGGYGEVVVVAPLSVLDRLCQLGLRPLRAEMEQIERMTDPAREVVAQGRAYRHKEFRRVVRLELVTEPVRASVEQSS